MPLLLIFGPIVGLAALAMIVAHQKTPQAKAALAQATQQFELDHGMPEAVVHQVLTALVHDQEPAELQALGHELAAKYPIAASELYAKAAALGGSAPAPQAAAATTTAGAASPDMGEAALILQAAMKAMTQETDPVSLEGFAESIRAKYPTAAVLLVGRANELRGAAHALSDVANASHAAGPTSTSASPAAAAAPAMAPAAVAPSPTKPATYVVQAGDTPTVIAERFTHEGRRWPELVAANPTKPSAPDGNFVSLHQGEALALPPSWGAAPMQHAHLNALTNEAHP